MEAWKEACQDDLETQSIMFISMTLSSDERHAANLVKGCQLIAPKPSYLERLQAVEVGDHEPDPIMQTCLLSSLSMTLI